MSWRDKPIWSDGMFLRPEHFQQHDRYLEHLIESRVRPITSYPWGFARLTLDDAALKLGKVSLSAADGVFLTAHHSVFPP